MDVLGTARSFYIRYPQPNGKILSQPHSDMTCCYYSGLHAENKLQAVPSIMSTQPGSHHSPHSYSQHRQAVAAARDQSNLGIFKIIIFM